MHFESELADSVFTSEFCGFFPIRNHFLLPLPLDRFRVLRRPAISDPVRHGIGGTAPWTSRETDNDLDPEPFGKQNGATECFGVLLRDLLIGMNRVPVTAQCHHAHIL